MSREAVVVKLPPCDVCVAHHREPPSEARYDAKTSGGSWAYLCEEHWVTHRASPELGTGRGQRLVTDLENAARLVASRLERLRREHGYSSPGLDEVLVHVLRPEASRFTPFKDAVKSALLDVASVWLGVAPDVLLRDVRAALDDLARGGT